VLITKGCVGNSRDKEMSFIAQTWFLIMSSVGNSLEWVPMVDLATGNWRGIAEKAAGPEMDPHEIHGAH
jgi:hypothetical protein